MKEKDKLEEYILKNRQEFDDRTPSSKVWTYIAKKLGLTGANTLLWWKVAAVFFFALSVLLWLKPGPESISTERMADNDSFTEVESYYLSQISDKKDIITVITDKSILGEEAERDLQSLDAMYEVLKEEYSNNPSKKVADALVLNLLLRIDILNDEIHVAEEKSADFAI